MQDDALQITVIHLPDSTKWNLPKSSDSLGHQEAFAILSLYFGAAFVICISFASPSLSQFPLPLQGATDPLGSLNFWLPLCGVINGAGPGTCWGQCVEHPVCHRQIHPCASTGSLFSFPVIIYSSQSTLNHLLFILFALSIISLDLLSQGTGE